MKSDIEVGQVLALKVRFNNHGDVARSAHPYLVVDLEEDLEVVEIAQIDSLKGKEWKAFRRSNKVIYSTDPTETVIDKDRTCKTKISHLFTDLADLFHRKSVAKLISPRTLDINNLNFLRERTFDAFEIKFSVDQIYLRKIDPEIP